MAKFTGHTITSDSALGDAKIQRSLRFNDDDSNDHYLQRTPSSAGNRQICTFSVWVKRSSDVVVFYLELEQVLELKKMVLNLMEHH